MWRLVMWLVVMTTTLVSVHPLLLLRKRCPGVTRRCGPLARSGPRGDEARRHRHRRVAGAELGGRAPDDVAEGAAEGAEAGEPDVPRDVGHRPVGLSQQGHRALDPAPLEVTVGRLAVDLLEDP